MVEGRLRKFYEEAVLLEQVFVIDTEKRVKQGGRGRRQGARRAVEVAGFVRMRWARASRRGRGLRRRGGRAQN